MKVLHRHKKTDTVSVFGSICATCLFPPVKPVDYQSIPQAQETLEDVVQDYPPTPVASSCPPGTKH